MKHLLALCLLLFTSQCAFSQVSFHFRDGLYNESLKQKVERNVSALLSEINRAEQNHSETLDLSNVSINNFAASGLRNLWKNIRFRCVYSNNVKSCVEASTSYEIRELPVEIKPLDNTYRGELQKELSISFDKNGIITGVRHDAIDHVSYNALVNSGTTNVDQRMRREILKFVEDFRSYYVEKNATALEQIFSDDALIITGRVIKPTGYKQTDGVTMQVREQVKYSKQSKAQYISNLRALFKSTEYINVDFSDIEIIRHGANPNYYGVRLRQKWASQRYNSRNTYSDDGYVFLLWDFSNEEKPQIYVRTWTPKQASQNGFQFEPEDFSIPQRPQ